jgi:membrane-bound inhibitor of C-type lysozyme
LEDSPDLAGVPTSWWSKGNSGSVTIKTEPQSIFDMYKKKK